AVELAMVQAAERNGELVADLAAERELLGEAHVVWLGGLASANQAGSGGDVLEMLLVAEPPGFRAREDTLVDAGGGALLRLQTRHWLRPGLRATGRWRQRLWLWVLLLKRRHSKREGRLDQPRILRGQRVLYGQDVPGPLPCRFLRRQFHDVADQPIASLG